MELLHIEQAVTEDQFRAFFGAEIAAGEALLKAHPENRLPALDLNRRARAGDLVALAELVRQHPAAASEVLGLKPPNPF